MALKSKNKSDKKSKSDKKAKPEKNVDRGSRKEFILDQVEAAGSKGIKVADIIKATDRKFRYEEEGGSRMRVSNTLRSAREEGLVTSKDGVYTWRGKAAKKKDKSGKKDKPSKKAVEVEESDDEA